MRAKYRITRFKFARIQDFYLRCFCKRFVIDQISFVNVLQTKYRYVAFVKAIDFVKRISPWSDPFSWQIGGAKVNIITLYKYQFSEA